MIDIILFVLMVMLVSTIKGSATISMSGLAIMAMWYCVGAMIAWTTFLLLAGRRK